MNSLADYILTIAIFWYILYPLFLFFMTRKIVIIAIYQYTNWQSKMLWGKSSPTTTYYDEKTRMIREKQGFNLLIFSWILGFLTILILLLPISIHQVVVFVVLFALISVLEVCGGFLYGFAKRDEIVSQYNGENLKIEGGDE